HQPIRVERGPGGLPLVPLPPHVRPVLLGRPLDFFFTVSPSLATAAHRVPTAAVTPSAAPSSARVMSGVAAISARIRSAWASSLGTRVFRGDRGATDPSSRRLCLSRRTHDGLTENLAATAFVPIPASQSFRTRFR